MTVENEKKMTPRDLILKMLAEACVDACGSQSSSSIPLAQFDRINDCTITDLRFDPVIGTFFLVIGGKDVKEEVFTLGLEVHVTKEREEN